MPRFLVSRRAMALHTALIVLAAAFTALALWQWDRAHSRVVDPLTRATVPLDELSRPGTAVVPGSSLARSVTATGRYDGQRTYVVLEGPQRWVMTPLVLPDGSVLPVVHGSLAADASVGDVVLPRGPVTVAGRLQGSQNPTSGVVGAPDADRVDPAEGILGGIATSELAGLVEQPIRPGFLLAESQVPEVEGIEPLPDGALVVPQRGVRIQNVAYTVQWTLFSAFVVLVYWRFMRDAWRDHLAEQAAGGDDDPDRPDDDDHGPDRGAPSRDPLKETTA